MLLLEIKAGSVVSCNGILLPSVCNMRLLSRRWYYINKLARRQLDGLAPDISMQKLVYFYEATGLAIFR